MKKRILLSIILLALPILIPQQGFATTIQANTFPSIIELPDGFRPEGIVVGRGTDIYAGSLENGAIYRADLRTGEGHILVSPPDGRIAVGLSFDARSDSLFVAGGSTGTAYVYDGTTGAELGMYQLSDSSSFVNDVIVTRDAAYFTDSFRPFLYRLSLSQGGQLPDSADVEELPLGGDFQFVPGEFNANGIEATANGKSLVIVHSSLGTLYRVDPHTGEAALIDLEGATVPNGDGLLLLGCSLYVVQNRLNQIAVVRLESGLAAGDIVDVITDPQFDVPTTIANFDASLYAVNARFGTPPTPETEYTIVKAARVSVR